LIQRSRRTKRGSRPRDNKTPEARLEHLLRIHMPHRRLEIPRPLCNARSYVPWDDEPLAEGEMGNDRSQNCRRESTARGLRPAE
jgi:hypothetical protein